MDGAVAGAGVVAGAGAVAGTARTARHALDAKMHTDLYEKICKSIPENIFDNSRDAQAAVVMIYLTALGLRSACLPFDNPGWTTRALVNPDALDGLKSIPQIAVAVGPYYQFGQSIIILYKDTIENIKVILKELEEFSVEHAGGTIGKYHNLPVAASRLFGYNPPLEVTTVYKDSTVLEISFLIDGYHHMKTYLPKDDVHKLKAVEKFRAIHKALQHIQREVRLVVKYTHYCNICERTPGNI